MTRTLIAGTAGLLTAALGGAALAHPGHVEGAGFLHGFLHPLGGIDHLLAMVPPPAGAALVGLFAVFHGHAHGAEMPEAAEPLLYGLGFLTATLLLHLAGIAAVRSARLAVLRTLRA